MYLAEREQFDWLVRKKALPVGERSARITYIPTLSEDGPQGRKGAGETLSSFLKSVGVFGLNKLALVLAWAEPDVSISVLNR